MAVATAALPPALFVQEITYVVCVVTVSVEEPDTTPEEFAVRVRQVAPFLVMVQAFTSVAFHDTVVVPPPPPPPPVFTRFGEGVMEAEGFRTVTVAEEGAEVPPGPEQVIW